MADGDIVVDPRETVDQQSHSSTALYTPRLSNQICIRHQPPDPSASYCPEPLEPSSVQYTDSYVCNGTLGNVSELNNSFYWPQSPSLYFININAYLMTIQIPSIFGMPKC